QAQRGGCFLRLLRFFAANETSACRRRTALEWQGLVAVWDDASHRLSTRRTRTRRPPNRLRPDNLFELRDVLAAAHGEVGFAAAFAAELLGELVDELAGLVTGLDRGGGAERDDRRLVAERGAE